MGKKIWFRIPDEHPRSYKAFDSLETIFWLKILKFFDADPGSFRPWNPDEKIRIRDKHIGSATLIIQYKITQTGHDI